jgi:hypothetical protein
VIIFLFDEDEYRYEYYLYKENFIVESDLLEELLGKGLKYTMVKMLTGINPASGLKEGLSYGFIKEMF